MTNLHIFAAFENEELIDIINNTSKYDMAQMFDTMNRVRSQKGLDTDWVYAMIELASRYTGLMNEMQIPNKN